MIRRIIRIDKEKCNGCGACAEACHEGAIVMADGKAQLIATYKNSKGIFEPKAISVDGGASSTVSDNSVIIDFTSANKYTLKAGGKTLTVNVSAEAPSAKTAEK